MNLYHDFLLEVSGRPEGSNLSHLRRIGHGKFANIISDCIDKGLIDTTFKNTIGEDLFFITEKGKKYLDNPKEELI